MKRLNYFWILLLGTFLITSCSKELQQEKEIIRPVRYIQVYSTGGSRVRTFTGVAQAGMESKLSFKVPGTVQAVSVLVGDKVKKGQIIAKLDPSNFQLQVQQAEAALEQAQAQARNASAVYERVRASYESNSVSRSDLDAARAGNESAKAGERAAEKQLELAKLQLSYARLSAPVTGAIAAVNVDANENVQPGQPIVVLTSGSQIEVKLAIPEILIALVKEGSSVIVTFDAIADRKFNAKVIEVGVAATSTGATFPVTVQLDKKDDAIRPGMAASVAFKFESKDERERFLVPSHAVVEDRQGRFVYVVEHITEETGLGKIRRIPVTIGELTANGIEIFEGLEDGDLVVTAGVSRIAEGMKVKM